MGDSNAYVPLDFWSGVRVDNDIPLGDGGWNACLVLHAFDLRSQDDVQQGLFKRTKFMN